MGFSSSLNTALSGLSTSQQQIEVVGNNIANVNTTGYKSTSIDFKTQFLQNFSFGSAPTSTDGGTNPLQIGLGVQSGAISTDFTNGAVQTTGQPTNMAIQGGGFFILQNGSSQVYTRDGDFQLNNQNQLVSSTGQVVQGYGIDSSFNVVSGTLTNITIPKGSTVAQATSTVDFATSNLDSAGALPTSVSQINSQPLYLSNGAGAADPINPPTGATPLIDVTDSLGNPQFQVNDVINFTGAVGGSNTTLKSLTVTSTTTLGDLAAFTSGSLGIDTNAGANGGVVTIPTLGSSIIAAAVPPPGVPPANAAQLEIVGNPGTANDITRGANSHSNTRGTTSLSPFTWTKTSAATGESINTNFAAYDSLGNPVNVTVTAVLASKTTSGTTWQFYATSPDGSGTGAATNNFVGSGTLTFDTGGNLLNTTGSTVTVQRANSGAASQLSFNLDFTGMQAVGIPSKLGVSAQDEARHRETSSAFPWAMTVSSPGPTAMALPATSARSSLPPSKTTKAWSATETTPTPPAPTPALPSSPPPEPAPPAPSPPANWKAPTSISPTNSSRSSPPAPPSPPAPASSPPANSSSRPFSRPPKANHL